MKIFEAKREKVTR